MNPVRKRDEFPVLDRYRYYRQELQKTRRGDCQSLTVRFHHLLEDPALITEAARALEESPSLDSIELSFLACYDDEFRTIDLDRIDITPLQEAISRVQQPLVKISFSVDRDEVVHTSLFRQIWASAMQIPVVGSLCLYNIPLGFLVQWMEESASNVSHLLLSDCTLLSGTRDDARTYEDLTAAFKADTTLVGFDFGHRNHCGHEQGLISILDGFGAHSFLKELRLSTIDNMIHATGTALKGALGRLTTLEHLELSDSEIGSKFVEGVRSCRSLKKLTLTHCRFDLETVGCFHKAFVGRSNAQLTTLAIDFLFLEEGTNISTLFQNALCPESSLKRVHLLGEQSNADLVGSVLSAGRSTLEYLDIVGAAMSCSAVFIREIPKMTALRELTAEFNVENRRLFSGVQDANVRILWAFEQNTGLESVTIKTNNASDFFSEEQMELLADYTSSNTRFHALLANPDSVETEDLPDFWIDWNERANGLSVVFETVVAIAPRFPFE